MTIYESIIQEAAKMRALYENSPNAKAKARNDVAIRIAAVECVESPEFKSKVANTIFASSMFGYVELNDQHIPVLDECNTAREAQIVVDVLKEVGFKTIDILVDDDEGVWLKVYIE